MFPWLHLRCEFADLSRLWCLMELFVYLEMGCSIEDIDLCFIHEELDDASKADEVISFFDTKFNEFDIHEAECFDRVQRDELLGIIEAGFGGLDGFNSALKGTLQQLRERTTAEVRKGIALGLGGDVV